MSFQNLLAIIFSILCLSTSCSRTPNGRESQNSVKQFSMVKLISETADIGALYPASIQGKQDIEIRPRVSGYIIKLYVDEGSRVKKGDALFKIDPVTFQEAVKAAEATVATTQANVKSNQLMVDNKRLLANREIISNSELQAAEYALESAQSQLNQAKAHLTSAKNDLNYCTVVSPSDGIVGSIPYRIGSLASSTMTTPLTIISEIKEIYAYFSITEKHLLQLCRNAESTDFKNIIESMPKVSLILADNSVYPLQGKIETVSGLINPTTGAVTLRARFDNPKEVLRSGGSGKIKIPQQLDSVLFIPQRATYELQNKRFVYIVTDSMTVESRAIVTTDTNDGKRYIVTEGLKPGERIVIEGIASLRNGMKIAEKQTKEGE